MDSCKIFKTHIEQKKEAIIKHVERVEKRSRDFSALCFSRPIDEKALIDAIWLHDIAKFDNDDNHNKLEYNHNTLTCANTAARAACARSFSRTLTEF